MIIFLQQRPIEILPPVISLLCTLKDIGENVIFLGLMKTDVGENILKEIGVEYKFYPYEIVSFHERPLLRIWQKITQGLRPYLFRRWVWNRINGLKKQRQNIILWSSEMVSAAVLGDRALKLNKRHIQSLYELGDEVGKDYWGFDIERLYHSATLIECEYNRAHILMAEKKLTHLPFILPNKPYSHPKKRNLPVSDAKAEAIVRSWKGKRVFLYQGGIQNDRGLLLDIIESLCKSRPDAVVAIMGRRSALVEQLMRKYGNISYVPFVSPPHHLEVTSHADVGIAYYQGGTIWGLSPLNPVYCAPNKIFEYAGFGIPLICNDIPGLKYTIEQANAGVCLKNITDESVASAMQHILSNYQEYSNNAKKFFDSVDIVSEIKNVLAYARG